MATVGLTQDATATQEETYMGRYVAIYTGLPSGEEPADSVMAAWQSWFHELGGAVIDPGNPFGQCAIVGVDDSQIDGSALGLTGYTILEAESLQAATDMVARLPLPEQAELQPPPAGGSTPTAAHALAAACDRDGVPSLT